MADIKSPEERSINMSHIKNKNTRPELLFRKWLFTNGYRYRVNAGNLPGHPNLWLSKYETVVFIHGCFWHRHSNCKYAYMPKSRVSFWSDKFLKNVKRDEEVRGLIQERKIRMLIVWECTIKRMLHSDEYRKTTLDMVESFLHSNVQYQEL